MIHQLDHDTSTVCYFDCIKIFIDKTFPLSFMLGNKILVDLVYQWKALEHPFSPFSFLNFEFISSSFIENPWVALNWHFSSRCCVGLLSLWDILIISSCLDPALNCLIISKVIFVNPLCQLLIKYNFWLTYKLVSVVAQYKLNRNFKMQILI